MELQMFEPLAKVLEEHLEGQATSVEGNGQMGWPRTLLQSDRRGESWKIKMGQSLVWDRWIRLGVEGLADGWNN